MATVIRPEISEKNKYWIDKHRHYELKHFCLQYPIWKQKYTEFNGVSRGTSTNDGGSRTYAISDPTAKNALMRSQYSEKIKMVEKAALEADIYLHKYILKAVTEDLSYTYLRSKLNIPCGRDMYYDRYRRFFWLLSNSRD